MSPRSSCCRGNASSPRRRTSRRASRAASRVPSGQWTGYHRIEKGLFQDNGAVGLLDEASKTKITGEEERYSHLDLVDLQANVEGSEQAFAALKPGLARIDPALSTTIATRFAALDTLLDEYRSRFGRSLFR